MGNTISQRLFRPERIEVIKRVMKPYLITRAFLLLLVVVFHFALPHIPTEYNRIQDLFDNTHYLNIAKDGYTIYYQYAFFPFVPLLIRCLGKWGFIILNQILSFFTGYLIYQIDKNIFKNDKSLMPVIYWMVSPISVFTFVFYTEGVFLFLTVLVYYLYSLKKHRLILGISLGLCVFTRSIGSMLFAAVFIAMVINVIKKKERFINILITFVPATVISCLYPAFLFVRTGNPFYFVEIQAFWLKVPTNIFMFIIDAFKYVDFSLDFIYDVNFVLSIALIIISLYLIVKNRKEKKYNLLFLYFILSLISITSAIKAFYDPFDSYFRYIFGCFSIYFLMDRNNYVLIPLTGFSLLVSIMFLAGIYFY